jgi:hypothetical protein
VAALPVYTFSLHIFGHFILLSNCICLFSILCYLKGYHRPWPYVISTAGQNFGPANNTKYIFSRPIRANFNFRHALQRGCKWYPALEWVPPLMDVGVLLLQHCIALHVFITYRNIASSPPHLNYKIISIGTPFDESMAVLHPSFWLEKDCSHSYMLSIHPSMGVWLRCLRSCPSKKLLKILDPFGTAYAQSVPYVPLNSASAHRHISI